MKVDDRRCLMLECVDPNLKKKTGTLTCLNKHRPLNYLAYNQHFVSSCKGSILHLHVLNIQIL